MVDTNKDGYPIKLCVTLLCCRRLGLDLLLRFCLIGSVCFNLSALRCLSLLLLLHEASVLRSVVGTTAATLHPQHVEIYSAAGLAVIAHNLRQRKRIIYKSDLY